MNLMSFFTPGYGLISVLDDIETHQIECNNKSTLSRMKIPPGFPCFMLRTSQAIPKDTDIQVEKLVWLDLPEDLPKFQAFSALVNQSWVMGLKCWVPRGPSGYQRIVDCFSNMNCWLVVWNISVFFPFHIWDNSSNWRTHIFSRWLLHHQPDCYLEGIPHFQSPSAKTAASQPRLSNESAVIHVIHPPTLLTTMNHKVP